MSQAPEQISEAVVEEANAAVEALQQFSGQPRIVVLYAIFVMSGDVAGAKDFLIKGPKVMEGKFWTKDEDDIVLNENGGGERQSEVVAKWGDPAVKNRVMFLMECMS